MNGRRDAASVVLEFPHVTVDDLERVARLVQRHALRRLVHDGLVKEVVAEATSPAGSSQAVAFRAEAIIVNVHDVVISNKKQKKKRNTRARFYSANSKKQKKTQKNGREGTRKKRKKRNKKKK
jgi:hypothetical protein